MDQLIQLLKHFATMSPELEAHLRSIIKLRKFKKGEIILAEGMIASHIYYIESGLIRSYYQVVLTDLQNRGVEDIFIAYIDNLQGFAEAIESVYPQAEVQLCIVHQIRNSHKYLSYKDTKAFMKDLQGIYKASTWEQAERSLDQLDANWGARYPKVIESWRRNWPRLSKYFCSLR